MTNNIAFIIPALNEEINIEKSIKSIKDTMGKKSHSIIVCDNGSTDGTPAIASKLGAKVIINPHATIAKLRNIGASSTTANLLVFIDADVMLDRSWYSDLNNSMQEWKDKNLMITGSRCRSPKDSSLLDKHWFSQLYNDNSKYINSGHLIATRQAFELVEGFNEKLRTSEDYDLCMRAKDKNITISSDNNLKAYHFGYPTRISDFIARESWHGKEDVSSLSSFLNSKTALASMLLISLRLAGILLIVSRINIYMGVGLLVLSLLISMLFFKTKFKGTKLKSALSTFLFFELYLLGRALSITKSTSRPKARR